MRIIQGRGNSRRVVLEVPTQKAFTSLMCSILGVRQEEEASA